MALQSPLPVRDGVNATRLRLPLQGPWDTIHSYVLQRFGHIDPDGITQRFLDGHVVDSEGHPLSITAALGETEYCWYYRTIPNEQPLPVSETILHQDEHVVIADKPHFLPTTPAGRFVQESLLVRLRNRLDLGDLTPVHRLDRGTAGLVILVKDPALRSTYQRLFQERAVLKSYECVSQLAPGTAPQPACGRFPLTVRSRIEKTKGIVVSERVSYLPADSGQRPECRGSPRRGTRSSSVIPGANAASRIELLHHGVNASETGVGYFRLTPHTGKTHQLRIHMAMLGLGILNDRFYPELLPDAPDDLTAPLQLLAAELRYTDPITGQRQAFTSQRTLAEAPCADSTTQTCCQPSASALEENMWISC